MADSTENMLHEYILEEFLPGEPADALTNDTTLFSSGIISSMGLLRLVSHVEETFSITLEAEDMTADRMDTIEMLVKLIEKRSGSGA